MCSRRQLWVASQPAAAKASLTDAVRAVRSLGWHVHPVREYKHQTQLHICLVPNQLSGDSEMHLELKLWWERGVQGLRSNRINLCCQDCLCYWWSLEGLLFQSENHAIMVKNTVALEETERKSLKGRVVHHLLGACISSKEQLPGWNVLAVLLKPIYNNHSILQLTQYPSQFCFQTLLMWLLCDLLCVHHLKVAFFFHSVPKGSAFHEKCWKLASQFYPGGWKLGPTDWVAFDYTRDGRWDLVVLSFLSSVANRSEILERGCWEN